MPTAGGPNILGESNLVFAYDTGDIRNSYIGEPTVNVFPDPKILNGTSGWAISNATGGTTTVDTGRNGGQSLKITVASGGDQYQYKNYGYGVNKGGTTFTYSAYIKISGISGTGVGMSTYWFDINGSFIWSNISESSRITGTQDWTRVTATSTAPAGTYYVVAIFYPVDKNGVGTYWITDIQIEEKSHATPFIAGTRSATQGLLPLIGNSTLDLSNVSFDSNAQMTFDGTDDLVDITTNFGTLSAYTFEYVAYANSTHNMPIASRTNTNFYKYGAYSWRYTHGGVGGEFYHTAGNGTGWAHWVITYDGSTISVWENGVSKGTSSSSGTADFSGGIRIGSWASSAAYTWDGTIPVMKMYNRALSAGEVRQNYLHYKTRFNLS